MSHLADSDQTPRKRLRKGTYSCRECRRRRVRCEASQNSPKCFECHTREIPCIPQSTRTSISNLNPQREEAQRGRGVDFWKRTATGLQSEPFTGNIQSNGPPNTHNGIFPGVHLPPFQNSKLRISEATQILSNNNTEEVYQVPPTAPLFSLFHQSSSHNVPAGQAKVEDAGKSDIHVLQSIKLYVPPVQMLIEMLRCGEHAWRIWLHVFADQLNLKSDVSQDQQITGLCALIYTSLHSEDRALIAKVILCISLHIQQLPTDSRYRDTSLQQNCLASTELLLNSDDGLAGTVEGLECMLLQIEFYINLSNLRKVWLLIRRAVTLAQVLGLHQPSDGSNGQRTENLWKQLWQLDRGFSMILGLPQATSDTQYPVSSASTQEERVFRDLGVVMGQIVERNQNRGQLSYSLTIKIGEALDQCKELMPPSWWELRPRPNMSPEMIFDEYSKKVRFYKTEKLLHLPFMLKSYTDRRYEGSRITALKASKALINGFRILRDETSGTPKMCDMVEFEAFSAAMLIVVDLVRQPGRDEWGDDWKLVIDVAKDLRRVATIVNCSVAAKGARVLEDLYHARHNPVSSRGYVCELEVPYFGKVSIRQAPVNPPTSQRTSRVGNSTKSMRQKGGVSLAGDETVMSVDGWLFPYSEASPALQTVNATPLTMFEPGAEESWTWFLGDGSID